MVPLCLAKQLFRKTNLTAVTSSYTIIVRNGVYDDFSVCCMISISLANKCCNTHFKISGINRSTVQDYIYININSRI